MEIKCCWYVRASSGRPVRFLDRSICEYEKVPRKRCVVAVELGWSRSEEQIDGNTSTLL